jgi:hypothetical protein
LYNKDWFSGEVVTPQKLNNHLTEAVNMVFSKNFAVARVTTDNRLYLNHAANSFQVFDRPMRLGLTIPQGAAVRIGFSGSIQQARLSGTNLTTHLHLDVLIDDEIYLSSLAAAATSDGVYKNRKNQGVSVVVQGKFSLLITQLEEGEHTFELVGKAPPAGDATYTMELEPHGFFFVEEYGVNIGQLIGANDT